MSTLKIDFRAEEYCRPLKYLLATKLQMKSFTSYYQY